MSFQHHIQNINQMLISSVAITSLHCQDDVKNIFLQCVTPDTTSPEGYVWSVMQEATNLNSGTRPAPRVVH